MSLGQAIATVFAGFLYPFIIRMMWDNLVKEFNSFGGWLNAAFIVGTLWIVNHGLENPMITQSGGAWVDMALARGVGIYVASVARSGKIKGSLTNIGAALTGGWFTRWMVIISISVIWKGSLPSITFNSKYFDL